MISTRVFGTQINIKPMFLVDLAIVWAFTAWLGHHWNPQRSTLETLLVGLAAMILLVTADFGHALAHIFSARLSGAPMDQVRISEGMPRTLYANNTVSPRVHRMRALGGPVFNAVGLVVSLAARLGVAHYTVAAELAGWSALGHGLLLLGSLLPLPIVDGGTLLKWTLVERGATEAYADERIRRLDWAIAVVAAIAGLSMLVSQVWLPGVALIAGAGMVLAVATGRIR
jgi:hypothetical protein